MRKKNALKRKKIYIFIIQKYPNIFKLEQNIGMQCSKVGATVTKRCADNKLNTNVHFKDSMMQHVDIVLTVASSNCPGGTK